MKNIRLLLLPNLCVLIGSAQIASANPHIADMKDFANGTGSSRSFSPNGALDTRNPFFQNLGSNGRACISCHQPAQGWTITPAEVQQRFEATAGQIVIVPPNTPHKFTNTGTTRARHIDIHPANTMQTTWLEP